MAPMKVAMPLTLQNSYAMYEYACHEGNVEFMQTALRSGRLADKAADEAAKTRGK